MPRRLPRRRNLRKRKINRRRGGKRSPATATAGKGQMARIVETIEFTNQKPNELFQCVFTLAQFPRALQVAQNFAFFKAAKVTWQYEPLFNTFQDGAGAASKPYLYTVMNRGQVVPTSSVALPITLHNIQATGARPIGLSGTKQVSYKPNWCSPGIAAIAQYANTNVNVSMGLQSQYNWLASSGAGVKFNANGQQIDGGSTNGYNPVQGEGGVAPAPVSIVPTQNMSSAVVYNGHNTWIDQAFVGASTDEPTCKLTCTVEWLYKGAIFNVSVGSTGSPGL